MTSSPAESSSSPAPPARRPWPRPARRPPRLRGRRFHVKPVPAEIFIGHGINQETRLETLRGYLTPASHFFVRSHATTPNLDVRTWRLRVEGNAIDRPLELGFDELLRLPSRSLISAVECAGNGRAFFKEVIGKTASGTQWRYGAIGVAEWTGVPLGTVLELRADAGCSGSGARPPPPPPASPRRQARVLPGQS